MTSLARNQNTITLLDAADGGTVRLVLPSRDQFCLSVEEVVKGCEFIAATYSFVQQVADLRDKLANWIEERRQSIRAAHISFRRDGILFVVVQKGIEKDEKLASDLTALDIEIASDEAFDSLNVDVLSVPSASRSAASAFLSSGRVQQYAGQTRPRDAGQGEPEGTSIHPDKD